ncbi:MAG: hypothetical protein MR902_04420 [Campylobacter sp.]|nr:hypothetical protein [Campylobacter sp.]
MKKIIFVAILIVCLGGGILFVNFQNSDLNTSNLEPLKCDLNLQDCSDNGVKFSISPRQITPLKKSTLSLEFPSNRYNCDEISAKIDGVNMYMGTINVKFKLNDNKCVGETIFAPCHSKVMRYKIELFNGENSLNSKALIDIYNHQN